uniref:Uncharacterized protein n=1 Tax=viral metagenome TaxID=1070528 RepID=A0A6C0CLJ2_9ZZZZ
MPTLEPTTHKALLYTSIGVGGAAAIASFSVWWFDKFWRIVIACSLAGVVLLAITSVLLLTLYVKPANTNQTGVMKRTAGTQLVTNVNNKVVPGATYRIQTITGGLFLTINPLADSVYQLGTTSDANSAAQFVFEPVGQVNELTVRPAIFYYCYTVVNGVKYYATTVRYDKNLDAYTTAEVEDTFMYFRPRQTSTDPAIRDTQFRMWPYRVLPEFEWVYNRTYEVQVTDEIYLSFYKYISMNQGCTLYQGSINYDHTQFSLFQLI